MNSAHKATKKDLVDAAFDSILKEYDTRGVKCPLSRVDVALVADQVFTILSSQLQAGVDVEIRGLGSFRNIMRAPRSNLRNPKTGEPKEIGQVRRIVFKEGTAIKGSKEQ